MSRSETQIKQGVYATLLAALGCALLIRGRWEHEQRARAHDVTAMSALRRGDFAVAARELRQELALAPGHALAYYKLGIVDLQAGRPAEAQRALSQAIRLHVDQPQAPCALGLAAFRVSNYDAAIASLREWLAANPHDDEARYLLAASNLGEARLDEAEQGFRELLQRQPHNSRYLYALGTLYLYRPATPANNAAALAALREAVALGNAPAGAYYALGRVYRRARRWTEAAAALAAALRRDPRMLEARHLLGFVDRRLGKESEARQQFRMARLQSAAAQRDRRLSYLRDEAARNPMNGMVHAQLGCLYADLKEYAPARAELEAAAQLDPSLPDVHEQLAVVQERLGQAESAARERALARRAGPDAAPPVTAAPLAERGTGE